MKPHFLLLLTSTFLIFNFSLGAPLEKRTLANGLTLITEEDHSQPLISICAYVNGGSRTEIPELSGLTHYFEHLIFRGGTAKQAELEMRKAFLALGTFYGYTYEDGTCYYITVPAKNLPEALDRYCDVLLNLEINESKVETERGIVLSEFSQSYFDRPEGMAYYNLYRTAFVNHPYGQTVIGDSSVVKNAAMETFRKFYRERYTPDKFIIAAVGDFETAGLLHEFERTFGAHPAGNIDLELDKIEPPQTEFKTVHYRMPASAVYFALGFHIPSFSAPEFPSLEILDYALFNWENGLLVEKFTRQSDQFNSLWSYSDRTKDPGLWVVGGNCPGDKTEDAFTALLNELRIIAETGLTEERITAARKALLRQYKSQGESYFKRAEAYCLYELASNIGLAELYPDRLNSVTVEDVQALARRIIAPENATLSLVLPDNIEEPASNNWGKLLKTREVQGTAKRAETVPVEKTIFDNGMVLLLKPDYSAEIASMKILVRGGQAAEPKGQAGINDFLCRLSTRGTEQLSGAEFSAEAGELGASISAQAAPDFAGMLVSSTSETFLPAVELAAEALLKPGFRDEDIESVRRAMLAEIETYGDRTYDLTRREFDALIFRDNPYGRPLHGFAANIENLNRDDLLEFHRKMVCGQNIIIAAAGNFGPEALKDLVEAHFANIPPGKKFEYKVVSESPPKKAVRKVISKERSLVTYDLGWVAPSVSDKNYLPMQFAAYMLNKVVFFRFVYEEGICYRSWARYEGRMGGGKFWFETGITPKDYIFSWTETLKEFREFLSKPVTEAMVALATGEAIQKMLLGTETSADHTSVLAEYYLYGFGADYLDNFPDIAKKVTAKQVGQAVRKYLKPDKYTHLVVGRIDD